MTHPDTRPPLAPAPARPTPTPDPTQMWALGHVVARRCAHCKGEGCHPNPEWQAAFDIDSQVEREAALARLACEHEPDYLPCGECEDVAGWVVTPEGRELLAFLRRFGGER